MQASFVTDPWFYVSATVAVLILGIAKGGLAGGVGIVAVPLMSLTVGPLRAAAILLPILMVMDVLAVRAYWRKWDGESLKTMIPGAVLGTLIGLATFRYLTAGTLRILVGTLSVGYALNWLVVRTVVTGKPPSWARGTFWSALAGFTSFSVHAGGPPIHIYLLSQKPDKTRFQATTVAFFFLVNWLKLPPYALLGQLDLSNLATSLILVPLAPIGIRLGTLLHHRINERLFFRVVYLALFVIGCKLILDGLGSTA